MAVRINVVPRTYADLAAAASPASSTQPEAIVFSFFDNEDFTSLWTTLNFFQTIQTDPTKGNIQTAGTLSADQYFQLQAITLDFIIAASSQASSGAPQIVDDLLGIFNSSRAIVNMTMAMKTYIQAPIHAFHSSGGISVQYQLGTPTGSALGNYAQNWYPDGGYWVGGAQILPPRQTFTFTVIGQGSPNALNATRTGRFTMWGTLYRKVA